MYGYMYVWLYMVINKERDKLGSLCIICSLGQVTFSLDVYIKAILILVLGQCTSIKYCYFYTPAQCPSEAYQSRF